MFYGREVFFTSEQFMFLCLTQLTKKALNCPRAICNRFGTHEQSIVWLEATFAMHVFF